MSTTSERFWSKVTIKPDGCWQFNATAPNGYGTFTIGRKRLIAHRFAYVETYGEIPDDLVLDHLCRNRACVNPDHLEPVTQRENILRGNNKVAAQAKQSHCVHGHPLSGRNLYITPAGKRQCKACRKKAVQRIAAKGYFRNRQ